MKSKHLNIGYDIPYGKKSQLLINEKRTVKGFIVQARVYKVPKDIHHPEGFKYSLTLIKNNKRIICFDNHERKGHHIHIQDKEKRYNFKSIKKLLKDFKKEVIKVLRK